MSTEDDKSKGEQPPAVMITLIVCSTLLLLAVCALLKGVLT